MSSEPNAQKLWKGTLSLLLALSLPLLILGNAGLLSGVRFPLYRTLTWFDVSLIVAPALQVLACLTTHRLKQMGDPRWFEITAGVTVLSMLLWLVLFALSGWQMT